jgi:hypothetical protein
MKNVSVSPADMPRLSAIMTDMVNTLAVLKTYAASEADLLDALTARCLCL